MLWGVCIERATRTMAYRCCEFEEEQRESGPEAPGAFVKCEVGEVLVITRKVMLPYVDWALTPCQAGTVLAF